MPATINATRVGTTAIPFVMGVFHRSAAVIAANESRLMLDGGATTSHEDVFPFRAQ